MREKLALAALSAALFYSALGLTPWWWAAWIAPVPVIVAAARSTRREARLLAWGAAAIGLLSLVPYYARVLPAPAAAVLLLLQTLAWGFYILTARRALLSGPRWWLVFSYPFAMAGMDLLIGALSPHGAYGSYAYTQMDVPAVVQAASLGGTPAVVFVVALFQSALATAWYRAMRIERPALAYGVPAAIVAAALVFGALRLHQSGSAGTVTAGVGSIDDWIGQGSTNALRQNVWSGYSGMVHSLAARGAHIVVLPEKIGALSVEEAASRWEWFARLARDANVYLIAGVQVNGSQRRDNALWLFPPRGGAMEEYRKQHLVPGLESGLTPGSEYVVAHIADASYGLAICRDLLFREFGRQYGRRNVAALLVPGWDFHRDAWMMSSIAAMRGVENGYAVVRAGRDSYLHMSDRYGRLIARLPSAELPGRSMTAPLPLGPGIPTFYAQWGDLFGWICVAAAVLFRWRL